jgi:hypothetical protein
VIDVKFDAVIMAFKLRVPNSALFAREHFVAVEFHRAVEIDNRCNDEKLLVGWVSGWHLILPFHSR